MPRVKQVRTKSQQRTYAKNVGPKGSPQRKSYVRKKKQASTIAKKFLRG